MMEIETRSASLLRLIREEPDALDALLATLTPERLDEEGLVGDWSVKQTIAHISWWERDVVSEVLRGEELGPGLKGAPWDTDRANALVAEAHRDDALADVLAAYRASFAELVRMIEELPDERLADEGVSTFIANNTGYHYREHREWIAAALASGSSLG
jgi:uncharacterized protein (TIGR03083 family)